jgi:DNA-binding winged helix-turn-helix (wHTH) protein
MANLRPKERRSYAFGPFLFQPAERRLLQADAPIEVEPRPLEILELLLLNHGTVVTYEDFKDRLWADVTVELNQNLNTQVNKLRRALGESPRNPRYVRTKRGEGYYFNPEIIVTQVVPEEVASIPKPILPVEPTNVVTSVVEGRRDQRRDLWIYHSRKAIMIACFVTAVYVLISWLSPRREPFRAVVTGRVLTMLDQNSKPMWTHDLPGTPQPASPPGEFTYPKPLIADIDGDGSKKLLFAFSNLDSPDDPTVIYCFAAGGKLLWTHQIGREIQSETSRVFPKAYNATWIGLLRKPTPQGGRILVGAHRGGTSLFLVEVVTPDNKVVGEYYHPGWLWAMNVMDLDGDGNDEVLLGGVNNAYGNLAGFDHPMTLIVLDSRHVEGQGPAPTSDDRHFRGLSSGNERAIMFFREFGQTPTDAASDFCAFREIRQLRTHFEAIAARLGKPEVFANFQFNSHLGIDVVTPSPALDVYLSLRPDRPSNQSERIPWYIRELGSPIVFKNDFAH